MDITGKISPPAIRRNEAWMLPSSATFLKLWLAHELSLVRETATALAVVAIRIDDYHDQREKVGSRTLEAIMTELATRLKSLLRPSDSLTRSSDVGFTVIRRFSGDPMMLHRIGRSMLETLQAPIRLDGKERLIAPSIGIAFYPEDGDSAEGLLQRARGALACTDRWGGKGFCVSSRSAARTIAGKLERRETLRLALGAGTLTMRFQPVLDLAGPCMTAVAAEIVGPIPETREVGVLEIATIADEVDLMTSFNIWLIETLLDHLAGWRDRGIDRVISIDLSRLQLIDGGFARLLGAALRAQGLSADRLEVRVDHGLLLDDTDHRLRAGLVRITELGVALTARGVGKGALAAPCLHDLPVTKVELAPDLIAVIGRCSSSETMLKALIGFMRGLGMKVRAGGVSSAEQLDFLQSLECDEAAGPLFAPAMAGKDLDRLTTFETWLRRRGRLTLITHHHQSMH